MTDVIQQNRYDRLLRRVGGIIGPGSKVGNVVTDLFPMIDVERVPGELLLLGGYVTGWGATNAAGVAAMVPQSQILNPADSGMLITVTRAIIDSSNAQQLFFGLSATVLATATAIERSRDGRVGLAQRTVGQVRLATNAVATPVTGRIRIVAGPVVLEDDNGLAVLPPGVAFTVSGAQQNTSLTCTYFWRERPAESSELNF